METKQGREKKERDQALASGHTQEQYLWTMVTACFVDASGWDVNDEED
jgi:hypothetical protein